MTASDAFEMAPFVEKASRLELIVRWLYGIIIGGFSLPFPHFLQFWHILIFGRRGERLYRSTRRYLAASTHVAAYLLYLTEDRPELTPDFLVFFKKTPIQAQASVSGNIYCVSCGAPIQPNAKFCGTCGAQQP